MVRITGGQFRSRPVHTPAGQGTRPTSDRVREALLSILGHRIDWPCTSVVDLYAGTGALGLECLSRGARHVTFVEHDRRALLILRKNIDAFAVGSRATVLPMDVEKAATRAISESYGLLLADPPYALVRGESLSLALSAWAKHASPDAVYVLEHRTGDVPPPIASFAVEQARVYGDTTLCLYARQPDSNENHV